MQRVSYRLFDGDIDPATTAHVEVNTGIVTEHATRRTSGAYDVRNPDAEKFYPLAEWIEHRRGDGEKVYRRRIVVIDDWEEVRA